MSFTEDRGLMPEEKVRLHEWGRKYQDWAKTEAGIRITGTHRSHEKYFKEHLAQDKLKTMSENEFSKIGKELWASNLWHNKDYNIKSKLLDPNGIDTIRDGLTMLLYGDDDIGAKYDEFNEIKGFGIASNSEILNFAFPGKYPLWNKVTKIAIEDLKLDRLFPKRLIKGQNINGRDYEECVRVMKIIKDEVARYGISDFIDLDIMFWYVAEESKANQGADEDYSAAPDGPSPEDATGANTHRSVQYNLLKLGKLMCLETYTPDASRTYNGKQLGEVATLSEIPEFTNHRDNKLASRIDVIWFGSDYSPVACFEVEHTTGIVSGLNRLSSVMQNKTDLYIVADERDRSKFNDMIKGGIYRSAKADFRFISYDELNDLVNAAIPFYEIKNRILGNC